MCETMVSRELFTATSRMEPSPSTPARRRTVVRWSAVAAGGKALVVMIAAFREGRSTPPYCDE